MSMTYEQAIAALSNSEHQTVEGLRSLVSQISVQAPGTASNATTLLYSGKLGDLPAWQVAGEIGRAAGDQVVIIDKTAVADFLKSSDFARALEQATGSTDPAVIQPILDGTIHPDGTRTEGMWDIASRNLAQAAVGDVHTLTPFSDAGKVYAKTELPALLDNPNVTHIDGIAKDYPSHEEWQLAA